jgi:hypothetical protein
MCIRREKARQCLAFSPVSKPCTHIYLYASTVHMYCIFVHSVFTTIICVLNLCFYFWSFYCLSFFDIPFERCEFESHSGDTTICDRVCLWLAAGWWFSPDTLVSSTNKTCRHDIAEILLKVALNTIKPNLEHLLPNLAASFHKWYTVQPVWRGHLWDKENMAL